MCFTTVALVAMAAGTAVSTVGAIQQGKAANASAQYEAQVARNNAIIANNNADYAMKVGQQKAAAESMKGAAKVGRIRAAIAANGLDVNSGSPVDVQESERELNKLDTETVLHKAQLEAYGYRSQSGNFTAQAQLDETKGSNAERAGEVAGLGTLLSGASATALGFAKANPSPRSTPNFSGVGASDSFDVTGDSAFA